MKVSANGVTYGSVNAATVAEELKKKGMHVTNPDRDSFVKLMKPAYDKIGELAGKDEMKKLLEAVEANRAK